MSRNQGGGDIKIRPQVSHPAPETRAAGSRGGESCPCHAGCRCPSCRAGSTQCSRHSTLLPGSAQSPSGGLIPAQLHSEHTARGINTPRVAEPSRRAWYLATRPAPRRGWETDLQPGQTATLRGEEPRQSQSCRRRCQQGLSVPRHTSPSCTVTQNPRGAVKGKASPRVPAPAPAPPLPARTTRSRTGCWFDLLPCSRGTL